jgi:hypothetical protein
MNRFTQSVRHFALVSLLLLSLLGCSRTEPAELGRFGVCAEWTPELEEQLDSLGPVWYYDYQYQSPTIADHPRLFMIRYGPLDERLEGVIRDHPGSWWAVGNEPNDPNQDNRTPAEYAEFYHDFWHWAKEIDRDLRIIPAGLSNADWRWAGEFRAAYHAAYDVYPPVDGWNIHNYLLESTVDPYDVDEFKRRIIGFRHWMMEIGEAEKPLFLTEFGVLYGSGCCDRPIDPPAKTIAFMRETVTWLAETDYVQHWAWFIANNAREFNGGLYDAEGQLTAYGEAYRDLFADLGEDSVVVSDE